MRTKDVFYTGRIFPGAESKGVKLSNEGKRRIINEHYQFSVY